jgi:hypothetical protein
MGNVFTCSFCFVDEAGVAQLVERQPGLGTKLIIWRALGPEAAGSNPAPGTTGLVQFDTWKLDCHGDRPIHWKRIV